MEKTKIIVTTEGGVVTSVLCNNEDTSVLVVDFDSELGVDPDEIIEDKEIEEYAGEEDFYAIEDYRSGVRNKDFIPVFIK